MFETINICSAKAHLSRLVDEAAMGKEIVIAKAGKPMARLVSPAHLEGATRPKKFGLLEGRFKVPDDFDVPLDSRVLALFEGS